MNKQNLLNSLNAEQRTIETAFNFSHIVITGGWHSQFLKYGNSPGQVELKLDSSKITHLIHSHAALVQLYKTSRVLNNACFDLVRVTIRNAITQFYEKIQSFCLGDGTKQPKWEQASWRPLARLARNSMSHAFILNFWDKKKQQLYADVSFTFPSGKTLEIKNTEDGQRITGNNLPVDSVRELLDVMKDFVEKEL